MKNINEQEPAFGGAGGPGVQAPDTIEKLGPKERIKEIAALSLAAYSLLWPALLCTVAAAVVAVLLILLVLQ